jgi:hypothetical protein
MSAGIDFETQTSAESLEQVRTGQRLVIFAILGNFIFLGSRSASGAIFLLVGLVTIVMSIVGVLRLGSGLRYGDGAKAFLIVSQFIPLVNIVVLAVVSSKATKLLREAGYKVGLLGASANSKE